MHNHKPAVDPQKLVAMKHVRDGATGLLSSDLDAIMKQAWRMSRLVIACPSAEGMASVLGVK